VDIKIIRRSVRAGDKVGRIGPQPADRCGLDVQ